MNKDMHGRGIIQVDYPQYTQDIRILSDQFLFARRAENLSPSSLRFYAYKLKQLSDYCEAQQVKDITSLTPDLIRRFLLFLEERHNAGGIHAAFRTLRAFLNWFEQEFEPEGWKNPMRKVRAPKGGAGEPLEPVKVEDVKKLLATCDNTFTGARDKAILLMLLDTGLRAAELLGLGLSDANFITGELHVRHGKGGKPRSVFIGQKTRKALRAYLKHPVERYTDKLFVSRAGAPLAYDGLRRVIGRRAKLAGIKPPGIHSFRRAFALQMLRAGVDVFSLQKLMGHADLQVLRRYLAQTSDDIQAAHRKGSPIDNAF